MAMINDNWPQFHQGPWWGIQPPPTSWIQTTTSTSSSTHPPVLFTVETCPWCKGAAKIVTYPENMPVSVWRSCTVCMKKGKICVWGDRAHDAR